MDKQQVGWILEALNAQLQLLESIHALLYNKLHNENLKKCPRWAENQGYQEDLCPCPGFDVDITSIDYLDTLKGKAGI